MCRTPRGEGRGDGRNWRCRVVPCPQRSGTTHSFLPPVTSLFGGSVSGEVPWRKGRLPRLIPGRAEVPYPRDYRSGCFGSGLSHPGRETGARRFGRRGLVAGERPGGAGREGGAREPSRRGPCPHYPAPRACGRRPRRLREGTRTSTGPRPPTPAGRPPGSGGRGPWSRLGLGRSRGASARPVRASPPRSARPGRPDRPRARPRPRPRPRSRPPARTRPLRPTARVPPRPPPAGHEWSRPRHVGPRPRESRPPSTAPPPDPAAGV